MKRIFELLFVFIMLFPCIVFATNVEVSSEDELAAAILNAEVDLIELDSDIQISKSISVDRIVKIDGNNHIITYNSDYSGNIFNISVLGELFLSNITLDGGNAWSWKSEEDRIDPYKTSTTDYLNVHDKVVDTNVVVVSGKLTLKENVKIKNFYLSNSNAAIINSSGTVEKKVDIIFDGINVDNCYGIILIANYSNVQMDNSVVENNYGHGNKGGLFQLVHSTFVFNNTRIDNNLGTARSGSIFGVVNDSILTMNSGSLSNNIAKYYSSSSTGSMITLESGGGFVMNDGTITGNLGTLASVISSRWTDGVNGSTDGKMYFNGGTISDNTTYLDSWNGASIYLRSNAVISEEMIVEGNVVVNSSSEGLINNGTIKGNLVVNSNAAKVVNNGEVTGDTIFTGGSLVNNGKLNNLYQKNIDIENNGVISGAYVKTLTPSSTQSVVTLNANGGRINGEFSSLDILVDTNSTFDLKASVIEVIRDGYTFTDEWYLDEEFTQKFDFSLPIESNITLYAKYVINQYTVTWEIDNEVIEKVYDYDSVIELLDTPVKEGFIFVKWDGYEQDMTVPSKDIKIVAVWEKVENPNTEDTFFILLKFIIFLIIILLCNKLVRKNVKIYE